MKKIFLITLLSVSIFLPGITTAANIIVNGDFESTTLLNQAYVAGTSTEGRWRADTNHWRIEPTGGVGDSAYARHLEFGLMLFQGIDAPVNGTSVNISLDYIYQTGIISSETHIRVFGLDAGEGLNTFNQFSGTPTLLFDAPLAIHSDWFHFDGGAFTVNGNYESLLFVVMANAFGPNTTGLRGLDNINLDVASSVPEPSTLLLLGSGLIGLVGLGRRRCKK